MNNLDELKRKTLLGQEALDRTKQRINQLRQELDRERQQRLLDEEATAAAKAQGRILQQIAQNCVPGSEHHLLTLLKSQGLLEIDGDRIFVKGINRYNQPTSIPLESGLSKLIKEQFPHFLGSGEEAIAPHASQEPAPSKADEVAKLTDQQLLAAMENPQKRNELFKDL
jgi:hypothetical protein